MRSALATRILSSMRTPSTSAAIAAKANRHRNKATTLTAHLHSLSEQRFLEIQLHRVVPEPDPQQHPVESFAGHRLALGHAVDEQRGAALGRRVVEHDARALLRLPDGADHRHQL